jgi:hypothetical protein
MMAVRGMSHRRRLAAPADGEGETQFVESVVWMVEFPLHSLPVNPADACPGGHLAGVSRNVKAITH